MARGGRIAAPRPVLGLRFDDARTLRWRRGDGRHRYLDLRAHPIAPQDGCPQRPFWITDRSHPGVTLRTRRYGDFSTLDVLRGCVVGSGRDRVLGEGDIVSVPAVLGPIAVVAEIGTSRGDPCRSTSLTAVDVASGFTGPRTALEFCHDGPTRGDPLVLTRELVVAWISTTPDASRLRVAAGGFGARTLETAAPGALTGLRADGDVVRWMSSGQARAATVRRAAD